MSRELCQRPSQSSSEGSLPLGREIVDLVHGLFHFFGAHAAVSHPFAPAFGKEHLFAAIIETRDQRGMVGSRAPGPPVPLFPGGFGQLSVGVLAQAMREFGME